MNYLYHRVPKQMEGNILYPLNVLKDRYPEIYDEEVGKYIDRMHVTEQRVPGLECLWNDVIHLSALEPKKVDQELRKNGSRLTTRKFFKINPFSLVPEHSTVYLFNKPKEKDKFDADNWEKYDPNSIEKYNVLSARTAEYYKNCLTNNDRPLLWAYVPHILYKGAIDISSVEIIEVH